MTNADLEGVKVGEPKRPKVWAEVTDDEIIEAIRLCAEKDRDGIARGSGSVGYMLGAVRPEDWSSQPCPPNAATGMGLIPLYGEGSAPGASVTARLKKLVKAGKVIRVPMVHPRGKPAPPGWRLPT